MVSSMAMDVQASQEGSTNAVTSINTFSPASYFVSRGPKRGMNAYFEHFVSVTPKQHKEQISSALKREVKRGNGSIL
jgi:hypothetical protein